MLGKEELQEAMEEAVEYIRNVLPLAHTDPTLKIRVRRLIGSPTFVKSLQHSGQWTPLKSVCEDQMEGLGEMLHEVFIAKDLGEILGTYNPRCYRHRAFHGARCLHHKMFGSRIRQ